MVQRLVATLTLLLLVTSCMCEDFDGSSNGAQTNIDFGPSINGAAPLLTTFAVLAASTVTSTGPTSVWGYLGVHTGTSITGFPPGGFPAPCMATSTCGIAQDKAENAMYAFMDAYDDAFSRHLTSTAVIIPKVPIGGDTFYPGLYRTTGSLLVQAGTVYLSGSPSSVFIFQIGETLEMATGTAMVLQGGALAKNVYWQVKGGATFKVGSSAVGNVMSEELIACQTNTAVEGRLFSMKAVTLDATVITCLDSCA
jgi:hypothetical protein